MIVTVLLVSLAGGIGACARLILDGAVRSLVRTSYPLGTTVVNVSGSLLLGVVSGLAISHALPEVWQVIAGTGFLGGYTTFSTASVETVRLIRDGRYRAAALNGLGMFLLSALAAWFGLWLGAY